ncbi:ATP-binding cassette domain-containing protein [Chitinophaga japonensis]|uniref:Molybdate transport system ATP-binding protein n=1 Tax=Chitinophaga japonensis TaxID=104662 RepID=A0A562TC90_CHIJA|nr:ATP-binding cassette domain-containing protein [Chitinophaga japonensis]TWI91171.1 molybdate transport system ATP-binding protein [Chitinophaga japonensis]
MNEQAAPFLTLEHITVRYLDKTLFTHLDWEVLEGQQWAITGSSGAGKTALLNTIAGKFNVINGGIHYHFYEQYRRRHTITDPYFTYRNLIAQVAHHHNFRNRSNTTDFYYQQRFNSMDASDAPTVQQYLYGETAGAPQEDPLLLPLRIGPLMHKELIKLSNGETRRVMIAKALLQKPVLLMLDNPFTGLDVQTRQHFMDMVDRIIESGITVLLVTSPTEIPGNITHVLTLDHGVITGKHTRSEFRQGELPAATATAPAPSIDAEQLRALIDPAPRPFQTIVRMEHVRVLYGEHLILDDINWTVQPNEKWALLGPNGAGKSTLLSLINADNPQAYANELYLFDRKRGSGESIWDIKRKIGFVSPELHQYFPAGNNCLQVVCSGFHDMLGHTRTATPEQLAHARGWMDLLGIAAYAAQPFKQVPESIQRLSLLARALVKNPPLLIFDEPCQGLDPQQKQHFKSVIDTLCAVMELTMIFVTHYQEEIPNAVTKVLRLEKGRVAAS